MTLYRRAYGWFAGTMPGKRLTGSPRERMVFLARAGFLLNLLYALYHGLLGVQDRSLWMLALCAYYTVLGAMRFCAGVYGGRRSAPEREYFAMALCGWLLVLWSVVLAGVIELSIARGIAAKYDAIPMITIAAYTFGKLAVAVVRAVRQRRNPAPLPAVIRRIGYAEVAGSVLTLQRSMLVSFSAGGAEAEAKARWMNALTGAGVCLFVLGLGVSMIRRAAKHPR